MARVLEHSPLSFFSLKLTIGAAAAYILYRCAHLPLARHGMTIVLAIYVALLFVHAATGYVALGLSIPMF